MSWIGHVAGARRCFDVMLHHTRQIASDDAGFILFRRAVRVHASLILHLIFLYYIIEYLWRDWGIIFRLLVLFLYAWYTGQLEGHSQPPCDIISLWRHIFQSTIYHFSYHALKYYIYVAETRYYFLSLTYHHFALDMTYGILSGSNIFRHDTCYALRFENKDINDIIRVWLFAWNIRLYFKYILLMLLKSLPSYTQLLVEYWLPVI